MYVSLDTLRLLILMALPPVNPALAIVQSVLLELTTALNVKLSEFEDQITDASANQAILNTKDNVSILSVQPFLTASLASLISQTDFPSVKPVLTTEYLLQINLLVSVKMDISKKPESVNPVEKAARNVFQQLNAQIALTRHTITMMVPALVLKATSSQLLTTISDANFVMLTA